MEKAWLSDKGIEYEARNVVADETAMAELEKMGIFSTPVTLVDDQVVIGFNRNKLEELLGLKPK
ncbi:MAG: glutaredoxin family protein [Omnitrophica WOR_2 bacterium]